MRKLYQSRKGAFFDNLSVFIFIIVITLILILCMFTLSKINDQFQESDIDETASTQLNTFTGKFNSLADGSIILWLFLLWIGTIVSSLFVNNYPVFFVIFITLSVISFFILAPLANVIVAFMESEAFIAILAQLPMTSFVLNHLIAFNAFFILTTGFTLYAKLRQ